MIDDNLTPIIDNATSAIERALEYHPWHWSTDQNVPDYCAGCAGNSVSRDDGSEYLSGLPCPEVAAIGAGLGLPPQQKREFGCWRYPPSRMSGEVT